MCVDITIRHMALFGIVWQAAAVTSSNVDQFPANLHVRRGGNLSMFCSYPLFQDIPDVYWWREGEKTFIEPDSRKQFNVNKGRGAFTLLNVTGADSGIYYCQVKLQQHYIGNGSGTQLTVFASPTPLKIIPIERVSPHSRKLVCKTAAFYPEKLEISWRRNNEEILTGIVTVENRSVEGYYEASSFLEETQPAVYTCLVSHTSLTVPAAISYVIKKGPDENLIIGCAVGGLAILVFTIILIRLR
ncbi:M1-specific T cell receptor beta chain-like [Pristis pectinata]|uniref:M1-specific T cell receptor beta chain-like n=1 Tax=Pristis pectinata TaxID=685728 RepID=UPI00223DBAB1|nr:M1-specific T cell receptor beta chain-like [Pristis pectinata]